MIFLLRHGCTNSCLIKDKSINNDVSLNDSGILQIKLAAEKLKDITFDLIISSPTIRTNETAKLIDNKCKIIIDRRILNKNLNIQSYEQDLKSFLRDLHELTFENLLIVTHGRIIKMIHSIIINNHIDTNFIDNIELDYGSLYLMSNNSCTKV